MNVLIIDDQPDVVAGIHSGINWDALSIRQVFCANDIIRAREILSNNSVDIMLCDIECRSAAVLNFMNGLRSISRIKCIFSPHMKIFPMHKSTATRRIRLSDSAAPTVQLRFPFRKQSCKFKRKKGKILQ